MSRGSSCVGYAILFDCRCYVSRGCKALGLSLQKVGAKLVGAGDVTAAVEGNTNMLSSLAARRGVFASVPCDQKSKRSHGQLGYYDDVMLFQTAGKVTVAERCSLQYLFLCRSHSTDST